MTDFKPRLSNPFQQKWRRFKDAEHDMAQFKTNAPPMIHNLLASIPWFAELEAYTGFHVFDEHPQTLQASFGHRSMFRRTYDNKTASENGASLVYSQGPTGDIAAILYPANSDVARVRENLIFLRTRQRSASKLLNGLKQDLQDLVAYELVTSLDGSPSLARRLRVFWLRVTRVTQRDSGYDKAQSHRPLTDIASAIPSKIAGGAIGGLFKLLVPIAAVAALSYFGFVRLAARLSS